jgi:hypothetical protein
MLDQSNFAKDSSEKIYPLPHLRQHGNGSHAARFFPLETDLQRVRVI